MLYASHQHVNLTTIYDADFSHKALPKALEITVIFNH